MVIFMRCPFNHCQRRYTVNYSDNIAKELTMDKATALDQLHKRVIGMLKKDHKTGGHQRGR